MMIELHLCDQVITFDYEVELNRFLEENPFLLDGEVRFVKNNGVIEARWLIKDYLNLFN